MDENFVKLKSKFPNRPISFYCKESLEVLGKGAYGQVYKCVGEDENMYAVKKSVDFESLVRDICIQSCIDSIFVVPIIDVGVYTPSDKDDKFFGNQNVYYVILPMGFGDMSRINITTKSEIKKNFLYYMVQAVKECHNTSIIHQDIKPANFIYFKSEHRHFEGKSLTTKVPIIKLTDFGIAKIKACNENPNNDVYTLWYRPPEILLGGSYTNKADVWALGCTMFECAMGYPLFPGTSLSTQIKEIVEKLGTFTELSWPNVTTLPLYSLVPQGVDRIGIPSPNSVGSIAESLIQPDALLDDLLSKTLDPNPDTRLTIYQVCEHEYFNSVRAYYSNDCQAISCFDAIKKLDKTIYRDDYETPVTKIARHEEIYKIALDYYNTKRFGKMVLKLTCNLIEFPEIKGNMDGLCPLILEAETGLGYAEEEYYNVFSECGMDVIRVSSYDYWNHYSQFYDSDIKTQSLLFLKTLVLTNLDKRICAIGSIMFTCILLNKKFLHPSEYNIIMYLENIKKYLIKIYPTRPLENPLQV